MGDLMAWLQSGAYLPPRLRDFHAQKDIFKWIGSKLAAKREQEPDNAYLRDLPNWASAHVYVIDYFLWYMALHGYTLQRSRVGGLDFMPLERMGREVHEEGVRVLREHMADLARRHESVSRG